MPSQALPQKASHYSSTHPCVMVISFLLFSALLAYLLQVYNDGTVEPWQGYFACSLFWIGAGYYLVKWVHTVWFTAEGLVFYRFGKAYRTLPWSQVIQVGVAKEYKASKLTIAITPDFCPVFDSSYSTTTNYVEMHRRNLILLDATKDNLASISLFYGKIDYHANHSTSNRRPL